MLSLLSIVQAQFFLNRPDFEDDPYNAAMSKADRPPLAKRLAALRKDAGLSQALLAAKIGVHPSNIAYWELSGTPPRGEVLPALAHELGVSVDELLGVTPPKPAIAKGRLQEAFHAAAKLPRRKQQKIVEVVEALLRAG
jgi:transcriptional regulator with XRE-family HTH domain